MLYIEGAAGISGDMTVGALLSLGASRERLMAVLDSLKLGDEFSCVISEKASYGIAGTDFDVILPHHHHHHEHECDDSECECHHHDHHEHHHDHECDDPHCDCHHHDHHHGEHGHHHHHHADEVFVSFGAETTKKFDKDELEGILAALNDEKYGFVLRAKGIVECKCGKWLHFDYVPGEGDVREGSAAITGRLCVIGSKLDREALSALFGTELK